MRRTKLYLFTHALHQRTLSDGATAQHVYNRFQNKWFTELNTLLEDDALIRTLDLTTEQVAVQSMVNLRVYYFSVPSLTQPYRYHLSERARARALRRTRALGYRAGVA